MKKRLLCIVIAMLMVLPLVLVSCGNQDEKDKMNSITQHEDDEEKAKARLLASFDYLLNHNGSGHLEVNTKILKRGQKEVTIQCSRSHCFIVDMKEQEGGN